MNSGLIFISYRRNDSAGFTRAIYEQLVQRFSRDRIFMDVDGIEPGLPFDQAIGQAVGRCDILLAMIGKNWMEHPPGGTARIHDPKDFVRIEIAAALSRNIRVIPVLLDSAVMPAEDALPEAVRPLAMRNAIEVSNTRFASDVSKLVDTVTRVLGETRGPQKKASRAIPFFGLSPAMKGLVVALLLAGAAGAGYGVFEIYQSNTSDRIHSELNVLGKHKGWQASGIEVMPGQTLVIKASGRILYYPTPDGDHYAGPEGDPHGSCPHSDCFLRGRPAAALVGKIGESGNVFEIGRLKTMVVTTQGELFFGINDPITEDNDGSFAVIVDIR